jgi:preprotein translocase subunit SecG
VNFNVFGIVVAAGILFFIACIVALIVGLVLYQRKKAKDLF